MDPSPLSSQPTVRGMLAARSAAAALDVMPLVPVHEPVPRPASNAVSMSAAGRPAATLM